MGKAYFTDYSKHMIRFYLSSTLETNEPPTFPSKADEENWFTCKKIFDQLSDVQTYILREIYFDFEDIHKKVFDTSKETGWNQKQIWDLMRSVEKNVARQRGLI